MTDANHLKDALGYFKITNLELSRATGIDASLISRYISGRRRLKAASKNAEAIAEFLLTKADTMERIQWLNAQFEEARIPTDSLSVLQTKKNLILWISWDGESLLSMETDSERDEDEFSGVTREERGNRMAQGVVPVVSGLEKILDSLQPGFSVDVFLTSDRVKLFIDNTFSAMIREVIADRELNFNVTVCVPDSTQSLNTVVNLYLGEIVTGKMKFYTFFGRTLNLAEQMYIMIRDKAVVIVTEPPQDSGERKVEDFITIADFITDKNFVARLCGQFRNAYCYSQAMFRIITDSCNSEMVQIFQDEYLRPGNLDVVKDSINPMYMQYEDYCRVLRKHNEDDAVYAAKCEIFKKFRDEYDRMLDAGMVSREIISMSRLRKIEREGKCRMAGVYFFSSSFFELDVRGCLDILKGYIRYLEKYPNFSLLILDDLPELNQCNCWHIKKGKSVAVNDWNGKGPVMLYSSHNVLIDEFQANFNSIWGRAEESLRNRALIIYSLNNFIKRLERTTQNNESENRNGTSVSDTEPEESVT